MILSDLINKTFFVKSHFGIDIIETDIGLSSGEKRLKTSKFKKAIGKYTGVKIAEGLFSEHPYFYQIEVKNSFGETKYLHVGHEDIAKAITII